MIPLGLYLSDHPPYHVHCFSIRRRQHFSLNDLIIDFLTFQIWTRCDDVMRSNEKNYTVKRLAPGVAEDRAKIVSVNDTLDTPAGTFKQVLKTEETNPLKPGEKENKFYAPGIGLIQDEAIKLVNYTKP